MGHTPPDRIIAHVDLLRAVDRLLVQADTVREKREALERLLSDPTENHVRQTIAKTEGRRD